MSDLQSAGSPVTFRYTSGSFALPTMHQLGEGAAILQLQTDIDATEIVAALPTSVP